MLPKATTYRIDPPIQAALENLSKTLKRPMNQLVNEAVRAYVKHRSELLEKDLETALARLRAYRQSDPDFEDAIERVAKAEAQSGKDDPAEGTMVVGTLVNGQLVEEEPGPVQSEIDRLLHG